MRLPHIGKFTSKRQRLKYAVYYLLQLADATVVLLTLTCLSSDWASQWLFSEYLEDN